MAEKEGWKLCLKAPPIEGKANETCAQLLAHGLRIPRARVHIVHGHNSRNKLIELEGVDRSWGISSLGRKGVRT